MVGLDDWRSIFGALEARYRTRTFAIGLELVNRIGAAAENANHHPKLSLSYSHVEVALTSHDVGGKTMRDVDLARHISAIAAELDVVAEPAGVQRIELALDTWAIEEVKPFWKAVLAMADTGPDELTDGNGDISTLWFQEATTDTDQRWHLDLRLPPEVATQRIAEALAAGGILVSDAAAPTFTVLADPQGNRVCICTHPPRPAAHLNAPAQAIWGFAERLRWSAARDSRSSCPRPWPPSFRGAPVSFARACRGPLAIAPHMGKLSVGGAFLTQSTRAPWSAELAAA